MKIEKILTDLNTFLRKDELSVDNEYYKAYAKVFSDGTFEIVITWNFKFDVLLLKKFENWEIRFENSDHNMLLLDNVQFWIKHCTLL